jgi:threonine-phosphate decarboxylase
LTRFYLDPVTFELDVEAFAKRTIQARSRAAIVVTPNNPTALSVSRAELLFLAERLHRHNILLVVDESFIDFAKDGTENTIQPFLEQFPNIVLIKSMSKVFGIAGLRLGYLLCSDLQVVESVRNALPIWNINGLGEAFLRTIGRYRGEFLASCERVKADRDELYEMLRCLPGIAPLQPDANFLLAKIEHPGLTGADLVQRLFQSHNILIKDCAGKSMQDADRYLRIASRTPAENRKLVEALKRLD